MLGIFSYLIYSEKKNSHVIIDYQIYNFLFNLWRKCVFCKLFAWNACINQGWLAQKNTYAIQFNFLYTGTRFNTNVNDIVFYLHSY